VQGYAVEYQRIGLRKFEVFRLGRKANKRKNLALTGFVTAGLQLLIKCAQGRNRQGQLLPAFLGLRDDGRARQGFYVVDRGGSVR
jgi:hypothetical protein